MTTRHYDAVILGGGLMGASAAHALAAKGQRVLVLEAHGQHHALGSSHGYTRITRGANFEDAALNETERYSRRQAQAMERFATEIVKPMPGFFILPKHSATYRRMQEYFAAAGEPMVEVETAALREMGLKGLGADDVGIACRDSATIDPSRIMDGLYDGIRQHGGTIEFDRPAAAWHDDADGVEVTLANGETVRAKQAVIAAGAWAAKVIGQGNVPPAVQKRIGEVLEIRRIPLFYFDHPAIAPLIAVNFDGDGRAITYCMPETQPDGRRLLKVGFHQGSVIAGPEAVAPISPQERQQAQEYMEALLGRPLQLRDAKTCLYTMTRDKEMPMLGALPGTRNVHLMSGCNGISAKHAIALGEVLSDQMLGREPAIDLRHMAPSRLTAGRHVRRDPEDRGQARA